VIEPEGAVRLYLMWLDDPQQLVDRARIDALESQYDGTKDPIDRLRLLGQLERARVADGEQLEADFVRLASTWAAENDVPASAFRQLGVTGDVLAAAGMDGVGRGGRRRRSSSRSGSGPVRRAKAVSTETLRGWMLKHSGPFTVADVTGAAGGSPMTAKKALDELIDAGRVHRLGPVPDWRGRGRAPTAYEVVGSNGQR
jgi:hypothetical protein